MSTAALFFIGWICGIVSLMAFVSFVGWRDDVQRRRTDEKEQVYKAWQDGRLVPVPPKEQR